VIVNQTDILGKIWDEERKEKEETLLLEKRKMYATLSFNLFVFLLILSICVIQSKCVRTLARPNT